MIGNLYEPSLINYDQERNAQSEIGPNARPLP